MSDQEKAIAEKMLGEIASIAEPESRGYFNEAIGQSLSDVIKELLADFSKDTKKGLVLMSASAAYILSMGCINLASNATEEGRKKVISAFMAMTLSKVVYALNTDLSDKFHLSAVGDKTPEVMEEERKRVAKFMVDKDSWAPHSITDILVDGLITESEIVGNKQDSYLIGVMKAVNDLNKTLVTRLLVAAKNEGGGMKQVETVIGYAESLSRIISWLMLTVYRINFKGGASESDSLTAANSLYEKIGERVKKAFDAGLKKERLRNVEPAGRA